MNGRATGEALRAPDEAFAAVPDFAYAPRYVDDLRGFAGLRMAYVDEGPDDAERVFLCLHGDPTWSFLYRKMIAVFLACGARVVAPDFFGFGRSDKPVEQSDYSFGFHRDALLRLIERLDLREITLVCQDWGGALGMTLPLDMPQRFTRLIAMNTLLATADFPIGEAWLAWRDYSNAHPDMNVGLLMKRTTPQLTPAEVAAYDAPFPDARYKAGVRAFPNLVPITPEMEGADISRHARTWWQTEWNGESFIAAGVKDPVLGVPAMKRLHEYVRGAAAPVEYADAGHFIQEWGDAVARDALRAFGDAN
jgi:pimeloyl-ACP methyl ester carboxylesterase